MIKPRMRKGRIGWFCCLPGAIWAIGLGDTMAEAYEDWVASKHMDSHRCQG